MGGGENGPDKPSAPVPMPEYEQLIASLQDVAQKTEGVVSAGLFGFGGDVDTLWIYDRNLRRGEFTRELNGNLAARFYPRAERHNMPWYGRKEGFHIDIMKLPKGSRFPQGPGRLVYNCFMQMGNWTPFYGKKDLTGVVWLPINPTNPKDRIKTFLKAEDGLYSMMAQLDAKLGDVDISDVPVEWCDSSKIAKFLMADAVWALTGEYHTEAGAHGFNALDVKKTREEFLTHFETGYSLSPSLVIRPKDDGQNKKCLTGLLEIMELVATELQEKLK